MNFAFFKIVVARYFTFGGDLLKLFLFHIPLVCLSWYVIDFEAVLGGPQLEKKAVTLVYQNSNSA